MQAKKNLQSNHMHFFSLGIWNRTWKSGSFDILKDKLIV